MGEIANYIRKIVDEDREIYSKICEVQSVDKDNNTCDVISIKNDLEFKRVRLSATSDANNGFVRFPVVGSIVIITFINDEDAFVSMFSETERTIFDGGENGGLIKIEKLIERINNIEEKMQEFDNATVDNSKLSKNDKKGITSLPKFNIDKTDRDNLENDNVQH